MFYTLAALCGLAVFLVARVDGYDDMEDCDELDDNNEFVMVDEPSVQSSSIGWGPSHEVDFDLHRDPQQQGEHIHDEELMELLDPQGGRRRGGGRRGGGRRGDEMADFHHLEDDHGLMSDEIHQVDNDNRMEHLEPLVWEWRRCGVLLVVCPPIYYTE